MPRGVKGDIDLAGYDGETLAFVEVRTRTAREDQAALPELSVMAEKQQIVARTARRFVMERHMKECNA
jgi:Holliday junction resolvase-like predicted endonuclease